MNRIEALRMLGLGEDATPEEIKTAYRESAQILHPDRFEGNKKLQERATEQFKNLQEAYNYLTKGKGAKERSSSSGGCGRSAASQAEARMAGIAAARTQLVAERDAMCDDRRNGIGMAAVGGLVALFTMRRPYGIIGAVAAIAAAACIWGIVKIVSAQQTINTLDEHIDELKKEESRLAEELDED